MFRPCIDVKFGKVVQLEQGERLALTDERSPLELAKIYAADELTGGHIIDLEGGANKSVILPALSAGGLQVGGGIKKNNGMEFLNAGATHLIFSSAVFKPDGIDWEHLEEICEYFGKERIVLAPDVRSDREIFVNQWKTGTGIKLDGDLLKRLSQYCDEFLIHSIEVEGMEKGVDGELVDFLSEISDLNIVYAGGATQAEDVERLHSKGLDVTIGKAYFAGKVSHDELVQLNRRLKTESGIKK